MNLVDTVVFAMGSGGGAEGGGLFAQFIPLIMIFAIFWFLVIRPQQKKAKAHKALVSSLKKGDEVTTDSGIMGTVQRVTDDFVTVEIAPKVAVKIVRSRVSTIVRSGKAYEAPSKAEIEKGKGKEKEKEKGKEK